MHRTMLAAGVALIVIAALGRYDAMMRERAADPDAVNAAAARINDIPARLGQDWVGQDAPLSPTAVSVGQIAGYLNRTYIRRKTGQKVTVLLVCGRPGPISVHTPDVCFRGDGYEPVGDVAPLTAEPGPPLAPMTFAAARFRKAGAAATNDVRVFWSWSADGTWSAPKRPQVTFADAPALYKLYLVQQPADENEPADNSPALDLLKLLGPELQRALFK